MIIEDGTGIVNADSYVDISYADDYFNSRDVSEWEDLEDSEKEVMLIKATDFIDNGYQWNGKKSNIEQSLRFPRVNLEDYEGQKIVGVPNCLKQAVCECCILILGNKTLYKTENENGKVTSERIGELSFSYAQGNDSSETLYETLNLRLRGLYKDKSKKVIYSGKVERV